LLDCLSIKPLQLSRHHHGFERTDTLQKDYVETRQETEEDGYMFDYVLMKMDNDPSELQILTRLFHTSKEGNIFYGRHIWCIGENCYVVWIDD
jgi:hypothetical protein